MIVLLRLRVWLWRCVWHYAQERMYVAESTLRMREWGRW